MEGPPVGLLPADDGEPRALIEEDHVGSGAGALGAIERAFKAAHVFDRDLERAGAGIAGFGDVAALARLRLAPAAGSGFGKRKGAGLAAAAEQGEEEREEQRAHAAILA